jgi:hypothetical protein
MLRQWLVTGVEWQGSRLRTMFHFDAPQSETHRNKAVTSNQWQGAGEKRKATAKNTSLFRIRNGEVCAAPHSTTNHSPLITLHWLLKAVTSNQWQVAGEKRRAMAENASLLRIRNGEVCPAPAPVPALTTNHSPLATAS